MNVSLPPKPELVIFDWDNTLVDSFPLLHRAYNKMLNHFDRPLWDNETARKNIRISAKESFPKLFGEENFETALSIFHGEVKAHHLNEIKSLPQAEGLLAHLQSQKIPASVFSNKTDHLLNPEIDQMGWRPYLQHAIGASSVNKAKPDPEGILQLCDKQGVQPGAHVWYVGDTENDMKTARAAQASAVFVRNDPMNTRAEAVQAGAQYCFASTQELLESLLG